MNKFNSKFNTFGSYIRHLRIENKIGQRELAKIIGVAPSYLNDIEKNKRSAPRMNLINKLSTKLGANVDLLYDLAGNSKKTSTIYIQELIYKYLTKEISNHAQIKEFLEKKDDTFNYIIK